MKIQQSKEKAILIGWSLASALLITLFVSFVTVDVEPSVFDSSQYSREILGIESTDEEESEYFKVEEIVDGDTIKVSKDGENFTVRLLGIDTPETKHPSKPVECFGLEASTRLRELVADEQVLLEDDVTQANEDKYGRLLRYVYLSDETFVNQLLIEEGFAFEYTFASQPYFYQSDFIEAQKMAQQDKRGLWADGVCEDFEPSE